MIWVPPGALSSGRSVAGYFLDRTDVTVGEYRRAHPEPTTATRIGGGVFSIASGHFEVRMGADVLAPLGDGVAADDDHPATQITALEAEAHCRSRGARLPTSDEWEHAARNGRGETGRYPWGDALDDASGAPRANVWQGAFPTANTLADGYLYASPVGAFPPTPLGFVDLIGNVWQWTSTDAAERTASAALPVASPGARVIRGGSFLCDPRVCHGYTIGAAQAADPDAPLMHVGFRCARDAPRR